MALAFTLPDTFGSMVSLHEDGARVAVVVFTCNHCPYALAWHERLQDVARDYAAQGVRFLQINANDADKYPRDRVDAMRARVDAASSPGRTWSTRRRRSRGRGARGSRRTCSSRTPRGSCTGARPTRTTAIRPCALRGCARRSTTCSRAGRSLAPKPSRRAARSSGSRAAVVGRVPVASGRSEHAGGARRARRGA
ncbi:redoxin domain-containing protein [Solirubrobacter sp. CPCC 204708]|nr:redoxin domain-containing protein [Solirubrobacter deserti]